MPASAAPLTPGTSRRRARNSFSSSSSSSSGTSLRWSGFLVSSPMCDLLSFDVTPSFTELAAEQTVTNTSDVAANDDGESASCRAPLRSPPNERRFWRTEPWRCRSAHRPVRARPCGCDASRRRGRAAPRRPSLGTRSGWTSYSCRPPIEREGEIHAARFDDDGAEAEPRLGERGAGRLAHADEHHTVTGRGADRSVRPMEFCFACRKQQQLGTRYDVLVKPPRRCVRPDDRHAVAMVEEFD